jgi:hypothetical protein
MCSKLMIKKGTRGDSIYTENFKVAFIVTNVSCFLFYDGYFFSLYKLL